MDFDFPRKKRIWTIYIDIIVTHLTKVVAYPV